MLNVMKSLQQEKENGSHEFSIWCNLLTVRDKSRTIEPMMSSKSFELVLHMFLPKLDEYQSRHENGPTYKYFIIDVQGTALICKLCNEIQKIDIILKLFTSMLDEQSSLGIRCKYMDKL